MKGKGHLRLRKRTLAAEGSYLQEEAGCPEGPLSTGSLLRPQEAPGGVLATDWVAYAACSVPSTPDWRRLNRTGSWPSLVRGHQ